MEKPRVFFTSQHRRRLVVRSHLRCANLGQWYAYVIRKLCGIMMLLPPPPSWNEDKKKTVQLGQAAVTTDPRA